MSHDHARIEELEKQVKRLTIKLETLVNYMQVRQMQNFDPPDGRLHYDLMVREALVKAHLQE